MKRLASTLLVILSVCPAISWAQETGQDAFARGDYQAAQFLWQSQANQGDPQAMLGLGLLFDRGFAGSRDQAAAFNWYLRAAHLGLSEAQFNVAVMYDTGIVQARNPQDAVLWYTRAALRGHARAQYNLGLIYDGGDGVVSNPQVAQYWFGLAASELSAAEDKQRSVKTEMTAPLAPEMLFADSANGLELVWLPTSGSSSAFIVEGVTTPTDVTGFDQSWFSQPLLGSGTLADIDRDSYRLITIAADGNKYAASTWSDPQAGPQARVTLVVDPEVPSMSLAAQVFASDLQAAGYWTNIVKMPDNPEIAFITYAFEQDDAIAKDVEAYLPETTHSLVFERRDRAVGPGEIRVNLNALKREQ